MTSFASFVSTDPFGFSADFMFGPITREDQEVNQSSTVWIWSRERSCGREEAKNTKESHEVKETAPTAEITSARRAKKLETCCVGLQEDRAPYDTASPSSARTAKRCATSRK
ncbi:hypothetical protein Aduo_019183 [Ancylostoma duodenale]